MHKQVADHIRSNVVGYVALFFALTGGVAWATHPGGANTISTGDIQNGQVTNPDLGANAVASGKIQDQQVKNADLSVGASSSNTIADGGIQNVDVQNNTLTGAKVNDNSLTGDDVDENGLNLAAEGWHEVGAPGETPFGNNGFCTWKNLDTVHNSAAFLRDRQGIVYLKGLVVAEDVGVDTCDFSFTSDRRIFNLPPGYRPALREVEVALSSSAVARVNVDNDLSAQPSGPGAVMIDLPATEETAKNWVSLDSISFRCAPSGVNGCP